MNEVKIDIIGRGNVGTHLAKALQGKASVNVVNPHAPEEARPEADILLISVSDNAISSVFEKIKDHSGIIAHTSGSTPMEALARENGSYGVLYPLQTFSRDIALDYDKIPFFIEGSDPKTEEILMNVAMLISQHAKIADSTYRKRLHLASVFACNFANHLWALAQGYLEAGGGDFEDIRPLIEETTRKIGKSSPFDCQTGPAARGDSKVLKMQMESLSNYPDMEAIYELMSRSIAEAHNVTI